MGGKLIFLIVVFVVLVGGLLIFNSLETPEETEGNKDNVKVLAGNLAEEKTIEEKTDSLSDYDIMIKGFAFTPQVLRIKVGDTVTWTNDDSAKHTVTSDVGNELTSSLLSRGQTYTHIFTKTGTYNYHCEPHPYMTGRIIVE